MRRFGIVAALAAVLALADAGRADAQFIIGTKGTSNASFGYYSPYPGAMYSPFAAPTGNRGTFAPGLPVGLIPVSGPNVTGFIGPNGFSPGFTVTTFPNGQVVTTPTRGHGFMGPGGFRR